MPIVLDNVAYAYAPGTPFETDALRAVNLRVEDGEFVGIMGQTGCGKSTLIQLIAGLLKPTSGRVSIDGEDINAPRYPVDTLRRRLSILFQYPEQQLFETTVARDVAFGLRHSGLPARVQREKVARALSLVGFEADAIAGASPLELSGGEKRRVALAGVLATEPRILILDEPIAGLDPIARGAFLDLLTRLNGEGVTIIMVSHSIDALAERAGRILVLHEGALLMDGCPRAIFADAQRLDALGLGVPAARNTALLMARRGVTSMRDVTNYAELLSAVISRVKGGEAP